jgi:hypothetical protein
VEKLQILLSNRKINFLLENAKNNDLEKIKNVSQEFSLKERKKIRQKQIKIMNEVINPKNENSQDMIKNLMTDYDKLVSFVDNQLEKEKQEQEDAFI